MHNKNHLYDQNVTGMIDNYMIELGDGHTNIFILLKFYLFKVNASFIQIEEFQSLQINFMKTRKETKQNCLQIRLLLKTSLNF